jgi:hypothetical protein
MPAATVLKHMFLVKGDATRHKQLGRLLQVTVAALALLDGRRAAGQPPMATD